MMDIYTLFPLVSILISLSLGSFIFIKAQRKMIPSIFFIICLSITILNLSYIINMLYLSKEVAFLLRVLYLLSGLNYPAFLHFVLLMTRRWSLIKRQYHHLAYLLVILFIGIGIFKVKDVTYYQWYLPKSSLFIYFYHLLLFSILLASLYLLYTGKTSIFTRRDKICIRSLFCGGIVATLSSVINLLPFFGINSYPIGQMGLTIYLIFVTLPLILRYNLYGVDIILKETFLFSLMSGFVMAVFMLSLFLLEMEALSPAIFASIAIAFVYQPLRKEFSHLTDRVFLKRVYRQERIAHKFRHTLSTTCDLESLLKNLLDTIKEITDAKSISILLRDETLNYRLVSRYGLRSDADTTIKKDDAIIGHLKRYRILNDYDLDDEPSLVDSKSSREVLEDLGAIILIAALFRERILAIVGLGEKATGLVYLPAEIESLKKILGEVAIAIENIYLLEEINHQILGAVRALIRAMEAKDIDNCGHADRVAEFSKLIATKMGLSLERINDIKTGASLHDIGKIGIPDQILKKRGELTKEEWNQIRLHPEMGYEVILPLRFRDDLMDSIRYHHERFDGTGYPYGLKADKIPLAGRIVACANTYDALLSNRPYRRAVSKEEAIAIIKENSARSFDPEVVKAFLEALKEEDYL